MSSVKILVDLDAILDTRLAMANRIEPGLAIKLLGTNWDERTTDKLIWETGNISEVDYKQAYGRRTYDILPESFATPILKYITAIFHDEMSSLDIEKGDMDFTLVVNIFPYYLSKDEVDEIAHTVKVATNLIATVELDSMDPRTLTSDYLTGASYTHYVTFEIIRWLKDHHRQVVLNPAPRLTVIGPMVREHELTSLTAEEVELSGVITPWEAQEQTFSMYLMLRFIGMEFFCLDAGQHNRES